MHRSFAGELVPLDLEIEATFRRNNAERKRKLLHDRTVASILKEAHFSESSSSNSPTSRESQTVEFKAEDALLAQNKLLSKQLEALTKKLSYVICGGAHDSSRCIPMEDTAHEVNHMGNQPRPNFNAGGYSGFLHGQQYNQQHGQWRTHLDQGGPPNRPQQQGPSLYDRTMKLEETLAQFMKVSMSNQKSIGSTIKNLEVQVGQLAKQLADRPLSSFGANT
ncbi:hypothetical protein GmHk_09G025683 [Glycine max]|nr:hypothetical protein GmHk_09G025683 [Glycine max]